MASFAARAQPGLPARRRVPSVLNTAVESAFIVSFTSTNGREVDQQVHLGFDPASFAGTPIVSANRGIGLFADETGHLAAAA